MQPPRTAPPRPAVVAPPRPPPRRPDVAPRRPPPPPTRQAAGDALVALVAGGRRTTGCAWERSARHHIVHHAAPYPPLAWHNLNAAALQSTPAAAFRAALGPPVAIPPALSRDGLLTPRDHGRVFLDDDLAAYVASLFVAAAVGRRRGSGSRLPPVRLHHHDLFHGHMVHASSGFALLLHAAEYPMFCDGGGGGDDGDTNAATTTTTLATSSSSFPFPYNLGVGQTGSTLPATPARMAWRNILAAGGRLASINAGPASPIHAALVWPELAPVGTVCESDLGTWVGDVVYVRGRVWGFEGPEG